jgi:hypothetical protein
MADVKISDLTDGTAAATGDLIEVERPGTPNVSRRVPLGDAAGKDVGTSAGTVAAGDHNHSGVYEPADGTILKDADIGVSVQAYDAQLADIAALAVTDGNIIVGNGTNWVAESGATARTSLGLGTGDSPEFTAIELGHATQNTLTGSGGDLSVEGNVVYRAGGTDVPVTDGGTGASDASNARTNLGLAIGSNVQAYSSELADLSFRWDPASASQPASLIFLEDTDNGSHFITLKAPDSIAASADVVLPGVAGTLATLTGSETLTNKTLTDPAITGAILEDIYAISDGAAFEIDPGNGSIQSITLGAARTPKATNFANGESVTLIVADGTAYTITWTDATFGGSGVAWVGGSAPTLATSGYTVIELWKWNNQVYGARVGDVA